MDRIEIAGKMLKVAKSLIADENYIYDPQHKKKPSGGGWTQTEKGWSKHHRKNETSPLKNPSHQTIDFSGQGGGSNDFALHAVQITPDTVITDKSGVSKRYGDMTPEEKDFVNKEIKVLHSFTQKGFSNYNNVSASTFHSNMAHQLENIDSGFQASANTSTAKLSRETAEHFKSSLRRNFSALKNKYALAVRSKTSEKALDEYENTLCSVIDECVKDGSLDVTEQQLDTFLQEDMKRLFYQELESRRRSLGDHGIRHLVGNAVNTVAILDQLRKGGITQGTTGKDKLMGMICQVNHDIGYTLGTVATNAADGTFHKTHSGTIATEERSRYADLLGEDGADALVGKYDCYDGTNLPKHFDKDKNLIPMEQVYNEDGTPKSDTEAFMRSKTKHVQKGAIQYHDDADYDWKNNAFKSAVALADCTSLFGKDKVQEFFLEDSVAMESIAKIHAVMCASPETLLTPEETGGKSDEEVGQMAAERREKLFKGMKKTLHKRINSISASLLDRDMLHSQVEEMTIGKFSTVKDILTRASGKLDGYVYDKASNTMVVNTAFSQEGKLLDDLFGDELAREQWNKMTNNDLHITQSSVTQSGQRMTYGTKGENRVVVNIANGISPKLQNAGVKKAYSKLHPRLVIQHLARLSSDGGEEAKRQLSSALQSMDIQTTGKASKGEMIFGRQGWSRLKELLAMKDYKALASFGLTDKERAYLTGAFINASVIARIAVESYMEGIYKAASNIVARWIDTSTFKGKSAVVMYRTDGEVRVGLNNPDGSQTVYTTRIPKSGSEGKKYVNEMISRFKAELEKEPEKWMKRLSSSWKKMY